FFEDTWRVRRNLTLSLGARYDVQFWRGDLEGKSAVPHVDVRDFWKRFAEGDLAGVNWRSYPNDKNNIAPRFGFAWSPGGTKTLIRGGYGQFFDQIWVSDTSNVALNYPNVYTFQFANDVRVTGRANTFFPALPPLSS